MFDLSLLFARPDALVVSLTAAQKAWLPKATEHAVELAFDEYRAQVVAYLEPDQIELYEARAAWETMQEAVVAQLEAIHERHFRRVELRRMLAKIPSERSRTITQRKLDEFLERKRR